MRKRQKGGLQTTAGLSPTMRNEGTQFGMVRGQPTARDGHTANLDSNQCMYIFGGDRHQMPFNDFYCISLKKYDTDQE